MKNRADLGIEFTFEKGVNRLIERRKRRKKKKEWIQLEPVPEPENEMIIRP